jgi:hypothetical protein
MKKIILTFVILASVVLEGIAQEKLKIGEVSNGKLKITNESALRAFLMNQIGNSGSLDKDIKLDFSPTADRIFAYIKVTGNKSGITSAGVLLVNKNGEACIVAQKSGETDTGVGGSATVTCTGNPCTQCAPTIDWISGNWLPIIICTCLQPDGICNQTITVTLNVNIGVN